MSKTDQNPEKPETFTVKVSGFTYNQSYDKDSAAKVVSKLQGIGIGDAETKVEELRLSSVYIYVGGLSSSEAEDAKSMLEATGLVASISED